MCTFVSLVGQSPQTVSLTAQKTPRLSRIQPHVAAIGAGHYQLVHPRTRDPQTLSDQTEDPRPSGLTLSAGHATLFALGCNSHLGHAPRCLLTVGASSLYDAQCFLQPWPKTRLA